MKHIRHKTEIPVLGEICSVHGRKIIDYDWKYGMKHIPVWKTNQLLNDNFDATKQQDVRFLPRNMDKEKSK